MSNRATKSTYRPGTYAALVCACLCAGLLPGHVEAQQSRSSIVQLSQDDNGIVIFGSEDLFLNPPLPLMINNYGGLDLSRGNVERTRLQLQLAYPLTLTLGSTTATMSDGGDVLGLDATLALPLGQLPNASVTMQGGLMRQMSDVQFQSLGNIECLNGTLHSDSYTASGCRFVGQEFNRLGQSKIEFGPKIETKNASASLNWFSRESSWNNVNIRNFSPLRSYIGTQSAALSPLTSPSLISVGKLDPLQGLDNKLSGVDLSFQLGIATDRAGDVRLSLQFTRVLDAEYQSLSSSEFYGGSPSAMPWKISESFDSARMNVEWRRGAFSSGVQGYYREPVQFLNRNAISGSTTFDVHFTWRAPWNADLSVGATNVLSAGADDLPANDGQPIDPFETIYGRIPYVRYKQDL